MKKVAVGFDFDHTLGLDHGLERLAFGILAEQFGAPLDVGDEATHALIEGLLAPFRADQESMESMVARFAKELPVNGALAGRSPESLAQQYREICYGLVDELVKPMPGAPECIAALVAQGTPIGILTNGWSQLQERKVARALGTFPGPVLVSASIGAYKPSALAFRELEAALGVTPAELWYVGDNPVADVAGARAYGLRAVWFNENGTSYPAGLTAPTVEIKELAALPSLVRGA